MRQQEWRHVVDTLWDGGLRPVCHAMPMPLRTIDDEYYAEAIGELERVMPLLGEVLDHTHLSTSAPRTVATQLVESRPQTMAHIPLGCGFVLLPRMAYSTGERLHPPRLVGKLVYARIPHPMDSRASCRPRRRPAASWGT